MNNVTNIDYELLAEQREVLLNSIWQDEQSPLWGVVDLLDELINADELVKVNRWFEKKAWHLLATCHTCRYEWDKQARCKYRKNSERARKTKPNISADCTNFKKQMKIMNVDIIYASDVEEFFYKDNNEAVPSGELVGFDVDTGNEVELVLDSNIYWNPDASVE